MPAQIPQKVPLTADEIAELQHNFMGPTWQRDPLTGKFRIPEKTLGWEIAGWCAEYLMDPEGRPWKFTLEQLRFVLWWYAIDDSGRFTYRTGVLQRMKGWGKDPLLAVLCVVELVGPSRFSHWDDEGLPVGKRELSAWVQVTAVNQGQTTNTMGMLPSLISPKLIAQHSIVLGAEVVRANGGKQKLEAVTSSYRAIEGKRTTFTLLNETHHWVSGNNGHQMYETIDGNATKMDARYLAITNAYLPSEDSVAQKMREAYERIQGATAEQVGFLYDSIEANSRTPLTPEAIRIVFPTIRGDAYWLNVETVIQSIFGGTMPASRSRRMWLNQVVTEEDALYAPEDWDALLDEHLVLSPGDKIVMGFDGGKTEDATALVAIRISDRAIFVLGCWERPPSSDAEEELWIVDREEVDYTVREAFRLYDVQGFYADVALWESHIDDWAEDFGESLIQKSGGEHPIAWDMRRSDKTVTFAHERLVDAVLKNQLKQDGDPRMRRHVLAVYRKENKYGVSFAKKSRRSPRKIDLYAALMLAYECLHDLRTRAKKTKEHTGNGWFL